jgi:hypothetical protein
VFTSFPDAKKGQINLYLSRWLPFLIEPAGKTKKLGIFPR